MRHMADNEENTFIAILSKTKLRKISGITAELQQINATGFDN